MNYSIWLKITFDWFEQFINVMFIFTKVNIIKTQHLKNIRLIDSGNIIGVTFFNYSNIREIKTIRFQCSYLTLFLLTIDFSSSFFNTIFFIYKVFVNDSWFFTEFFSSTLFYLLRFQQWKISVFYSKRHLFLLSKKTSYFVWKH